MVLGLDVDKLGHLADLLGQWFRLVQVNFGFGGSQKGLKLL